MSGALSKVVMPMRRQRRGSYLRHIGLACALVLAFISASLTVALAKTNKLVGVVFDNSGSMEGRTNMPVFGIQMLAASLTRSDRLYGMTFKQFRAVSGGRTDVDDATLADPSRLRSYMTPFPLTDASAQQNAINAIKRWAIQPNVNTPFAPVLIMLTFLAQSATPDDDVHLFIFTDGGFNDPVNLGVLEQRINLLKQNTKAKSLSVHFLAFVADRSERDLIVNQGIASLLDRTINTNKIGNFDYVFYATDFASLRKQMVNIVSRISETEPEQAQLAASIVKRSGNKIVVNAPVTITKIIVVSTAPEIQGLAPDQGSAAERACRH